MKSDSTMENWNVNRCAHPECLKYKTADQYACARHWKTLPKSIQTKIWDGYHGRNGVLWLDAHKEAQKFWGAKVKPKPPEQQELKL